MVVSLTPAEWEELQLRETIEGADSVLDFIPSLTPGFMRPDHLRQLAEAFARMEHEPVRLLISVPRRHGKTETCMGGAVRYLCRHPRKMVGYTAYSGDFAFDKSKRMRDLATQAGLLLRPDANKASLWRTRASGGLIASGIGGPLTGHGVDLLIVDDPHKNREEADSPAMRRQVHEWFTSTGISSVEPRGSVIVCHTRWHQDDLIGTLLRDKDVKWEHVNLSALDESGNALWPERWPVSELLKRKREVGEYDWASLYMGQPRPRGGQLFREATRYEKPDVLGSTILIACDPAATASTSADRSAILVAAGKVDAEGLTWMDVLDVHTMQVAIPSLVGELITTQKAWGAPIAVENVGGFKAVPDMLRAIDRGLRIFEITPQGDKFVRAQRVAAAWNDGRVRVPVSAPWVGAFTDEVCRFTGVGDSHDDQVDALAHCWNTLETLLHQRRDPSETDFAAPMGC